ncbi:MAG TPA: molybdate ABC transporter substrate-binding protein [Bryobacteraceae bacterium]|nr:molybdate ABC transporter substrate-binding protein [Bryobacteraceae bacterium]
MRLTAFVLLFAAALAHSAPPPEVTVAAAANLSRIFQLIGPEFQTASGIHPVFSFGSTAQLTQQIENAAPYDIFTAADSAHLDQLDREGKLTPGSKAVYATGILALWIPPAGHARIEHLTDLTSPAVRVIAIARPELAPYGEATVETLRHLGIWDRVKSKAVYADSIGMAKQYGTSGNADAVFTAWSLVLKQDGKVIRVDENLHKPIEQALGIMAASHHQSNAAKFADFLIKGKGREILATQGYRVPEQRP